MELVDVWRVLGVPGAYVEGARSEYFVLEAQIPPT